MVQAWNIAGFNVEFPSFTEAFDSVTESAVTTGTAVLEHYDSKGQAFERGFFQFYDNYEASSYGFSPVIDYTVGGLKSAWIEMAEEYAAEGIYYDPLYYVVLGDIAGITIVQGIGDFVGSMAGTIIHAGIGLYQTDQVMHALPGAITTQMSTGHAEIPAILPEGTFGQADYELFTGSLSHLLWGVIDMASRLGELGVSPLLGGIDTVSDCLTDQQFMSTRHQNVDHMRQALEQGDYLEFARTLASDISDYRASVDARLKDNVSDQVYLHSGHLLLSIGTFFGYDAEQSNGTNAAVIVGNMLTLALLVKAGKGGRNGRGAQARAEPIVEVPTQARAVEVVQAVIDPALEVTVSDFSTARVAPPRQYAPSPGGTVNAPGAPVEVTHYNPPTVKTVFGMRYFDPNALPESVPPAGPSTPLIDSVIRNQGLPDFASSNPFVNLFRRDTLIDARSAAEPTVVEAMLESARRSSLYNPFEGISFGNAVEGITHYAYEYANRVTEPIAGEALHGPRRTSSEPSVPEAPITDPTPIGVADVSPRFWSDYFESTEPLIVDRQSNAAK